MLSFVKKTKEVVEILMPTPKTPKDLKVRAAQSRSIVTTRIPMWPERLSKTSSSQKR